jgi:hypothetical protein
MLFLPCGEENKPCSFDEVEIISASTKSSLF